MCGYHSDGKDKLYAICEGMFRGSYHVSQHESYVCGYHSDVMIFVIGKDKLYVVCICVVTMACALF